ncbi:hypothetical protein RED65_02438 [Oceanobacter sp. RED65]|uniref:Uncharacterized protein n=2 Tax=Bermanella marisrubri TaxID=207949 RepID=Q1MY69_9GAMM|nr:hypothetical protein RED65_02438 [Oceanobacter sp. RED65] [Bermanella marisrubri]
MNSRALALLFSLAPIYNNAASDEAIITPALQIIESNSQSTKVNTTNSEGLYSLDQENIQRFQESNGSLTEVLDTVPNVQFSDDHDSTESKISIKPASVSISGGRFYDNNFSINGMSNNSLLDPAGANTSDNAINDLSGHEQAIFLDIDQLESISIYDSNVPVEYGHFTGGVIDAQIRPPSYETKTGVSYYTTYSDWSDFHIIVNNDNDDDPTYETPQAPKYSKQRFKISHEQPINDDHSLRLSLNQTQSVTSELTYNQTKSISSNNTGLSLTHGYETDELFITNFFTYSPYQKSTFQKNVKGSDFQIEGGGFTANSKIEFYRGRQTHNVSLATSYSTNSRNAPAHFYNWKNSNSRQWGLDAGLSSSKEGGFGDLDKSQAELSGNWKVSIPIQHPNIKQWLYGGTLTQSMARFSRPQDTYIYSGATINTQVQCLGYTSDCVTNEQYFRERKIYPEDSAEVSLSQASIYSELEVNVSKLKTSLGVRLDYDNFLNNINIAWRTRGTYDWFDNNSLIIVGGINRYFSGPLLTYKLREAAKPFYQEYRGTTQNIVNDWEYDSETGDYRYDTTNVRTPYSDEITLSTKFKILEGATEIKAISRVNNDEFARTVTDKQDDGYRYYRLNNQGFSRYQSLSISWDRSNTYFSYGFNIFWSKTKSSNDSYDENVDAATNDEFVWYKNERRTLSEISQLRENFARPLIGSVYSFIPLGKQLSLSIKGRYKSRYTTVVKGSGETYTGIVDKNGTSYAEYLDNYEEKKQRATMLFDSTVRWLPSSQSDIALVSEIKNLTNTRTYSITDSEDGIEIGRSFWFGIDAKW